MISSPAPSQRVAGILGFFFVLLGGGLILDADRHWLGSITITVGGWLMLTASRGRDLDWNAS